MAKMGLVSAELSLRAAGSRGASGFRETRREDDAATETPHSEHVPPSWGIAASAGVGLALGDSTAVSRLGSQSVTH